MGKRIANSLISLLFMSAVFASGTALTTEPASSPATTTVKPAFTVSDTHVADPASTTATLTTELSHAPDPVFTVDSILFRYHERRGEVQ